MNKSFKRINLIKGDTVAITAGKDKGKSGKIISVDRTAGKITVEGLNIRHRFERARGRTPGQKVSFPGAINPSKVILICQSCGKATRIAYKFLENGKKQRICRKCEKAI